MSSFGPPGDPPDADPNVDLANFAVRVVPFDEWLDIDTIVHRSSLTSGDFDYILRPLCPDCGRELEFDYETLEADTDGAAQAIRTAVRARTRSGSQIAAVMAVAASSKATAEVGPQARRRTSAS